MAKRLVLAAALMACANAMAQPASSAGPHAPGPNAGPAQSRVNAEPLSRADFLARAAKYFDKSDLNRDGRITPEEQRTAMQARLAARNRPEQPQALPAGTQDTRRPGAPEKR